MKSTWYFVGIYSLLYIIIIPSIAPFSVYFPQYYTPLCKGVILWGPTWGRLNSVSPTDNTTMLEVPKYLLAWMENTMGALRDVEEEGKLIWIQPPVLLCSGTSLRCSINPRTQSSLCNFKKQNMVPIPVLISGGTWRKFTRFLWIPGEIAFQFLLFCPKCYLQNNQVKRKINDGFYS